MAALIRRESMSIASLQKLWCSRHGIAARSNPLSREIRQVSSLCTRQLLCDREALAEVCILLVCIAETVR